MTWPILSLVVFKNHCVPDMLTHANKRSFPPRLTGAIVVSSVRVVFFPFEMLPDRVPL